MKSKGNVKQTLVFALLMHIQLFTHPVLANEDIERENLLKMTFELPREINRRIGLEVSSVNMEKFSKVLSGAKNIEVQPEVVHIFVLYSRGMHNMPRVERQTPEDLYKWLQPILEAKSTKSTPRHITSQARLNVQAARDLGLIESLKSTSSTRRRKSKAELTGGKKTDSPMRNNFINASKKVITATTAFSRRASTDMGLSKKTGTSNKERTPNAVHDSSSGTGKQTPPKTKARIPRTMSSPDISSMGSLNNDQKRNTNASKTPIPESSSPQDPGSESLYSQITNSTLEETAMSPSEHMESSVTTIEEEEHVVEGCDPSSSGGCQPTILEANSPSAGQKVQESQPTSASKTLKDPVLKKGTMKTASSAKTPPSSTGRSMGSMTLAGRSQSVESLVTKSKTPKLLKVVTKAQEKAKAQKAEKELKGHNGSFDIAKSLHATVKKLKQLGQKHGSEKGGAKSSGKVTASDKVRDDVRTAPVGAGGLTDSNDEKNFNRSACMRQPIMRRVSSTLSLANSSNDGEQEYSKTPLSSGYPSEGNLTNDSLYPDSCQYNSDTESVLQDEASNSETNSQQDAQSLKGSEVGRKKQQREQYNASIREEQIPMSYKSKLLKSIAKENVEAHDEPADRAKRSSLKTNEDATQAGSNNIYDPEDKEELQKLIDEHGICKPFQEYTRSRYISWERELREILRYVCDIEHFRDDGYLYDVDDGLVSDIVDWHDPGPYSAYFPQETVLQTSENFETVEFEDRGRLIVKVAHKKYGGWFEPQIMIILKSKNELHKEIGWSLSNKEPICDNDCHKDVKEEVRHYAATVDREDQYLDATVSGALKRFPLRYYMYMKTGITMEEGFTDRSFAKVYRAFDFYTKPAYMETAGTVNYEKIEQLANAMVPMIPVAASPKIELFPESQHDEAFVVFHNAYVNNLLDVDDIFSGDGILRVTQFVKRRQNTFAFIITFVCLNILVTLLSLIAIFVMLIKTRSPPSQKHSASSYNALWDLLALARCRRL